MFELFSPPSQRNSETNDTSFEIPNIELFEIDKNWTWHYSGGGHAHVTHKATLLKILYGI